MRPGQHAKRDAMRIWRLCHSDGTTNDEFVLRTVDMLLASSRQGSLIVLRHFLELVRRDLRRRTARIESATPLGEDARAVIERSLSARYGRAITATCTVAPTLIGGMRIRIGSDLYDGSVTGALAAVESQFDQAVRSGEVRA